MAKLFQTALLASLTGSVLLAITPTAQSQIAVQGGNMTGDAAFFNPNVGRTTLFDATIRTLNLRTSNGVTNTSVFLPSASNYNAQGRFPTSGDTGTFQGTLAGVAFTPSGVPIGFSGIPTTLDFTLTSFNRSGGLFGSLVTPKPGVNALPLYFPVQNVRLDASSTPFYNTPIDGALEVGRFAADVNGGLISLPSSLQFRPLSNVNVPQVLLGRPTTFAFSGVKPVTDTNPSVISSPDFNPLDGRVSLQADGNPSNPVLDVAFTIQVAGAPPISGVADGVRFGVSGVDSFLQVGSLSETPGTPTFFRVSGSGIGVSAFVNDTTIGYLSPRTNTSFLFQQATGSLSGTSSGDAVLRLGTLQPAAGFTLSIQDCRCGAGPFGTGGRGGQTPPPAPNIPTIPPSGGSNTSASTSVGQGGSNSVSGGRIFSIVGIQTNPIDVSWRDEVLFRLASLDVVIYRILTVDIIEYTLERGRGQSTIIVGRTADGRPTNAYEQMGPGSTIFPGLVGMKQIGVAQVPSPTPTPTPSPTPTPTPSPTPTPTPSPTPTTTPSPVPSPPAPPPAPQPEPSTGPLVPIPR